MWTQPAVFFPLLGHHSVLKSPLSFLFIDQQTLVFVAVQYNSAKGKVRLYLFCLSLIMKSTYIALLCASCGFRWLNWKIAISSACRASQICYTFENSKSSWTTAWMCFWTCSAYMTCLILSVFFLWHWLVQYQFLFPVPCSRNKISQLNHFKVKRNDLYYFTYNQFFFYCENNNAI